MYSVLYNLKYTSLLLFMKYEFLQRIIWIHYEAFLKQFFKSVPSIVECFYFKRIHCYLDFRVICMYVQLLIRASPSATHQYRNSYSNSRFSPRGFDRTWVKRRDVSQGREDHVHRVSIIGGCASSWKMQCASSAYLRITLQTEPPPIECCAPA